MSGWIQILLWAAGGVFVLAAGLAIAVMASSPLTVFNAVVPKEMDVVVERGIAYGQHKRQILDIYRPAVADNLPVIFFSYGGGWNSGDRGDYGFVGHAFAASGYVVIIADYRLVPEIGYPDFVADNALALKFVMQRMTDYGGDGSRLFLMGHSAGAYNVSMLALDPQFGISSRSIAGVIGLSGPYDFYPFDVDASRDAFEGYARPEDTQPVNLVADDAPPMLLVHGDADRTVLLRNSTALLARLQSVGAEQSALQVYEGAGHAETLIGLAMPLRWRYPVLNDVLAFMDAMAVRN